MIKTLRLLRQQRQWLLITVIVIDNVPIVRLLLLEHRCISKCAHGHTWALILNTKDSIIGGEWRRHSWTCAAWRSGWPTMTMTGRTSPAARITSGSGGAYCATRAPHGLWCPRPLFVVYDVEGQTVIERGQPGKLAPTRLSSPTRQACRLRGTYSVTDTVYFRSDSFRRNDERPYSSVHGGGIPFPIPKRRTGNLTASSDVARNWSKTGSAPSCIADFHPQSFWNFFTTPPELLWAIQVSRTYLLTNADSSHIRSTQFQMTPYSISEQRY